MPSWVYLVYDCRAHGRRFGQYCTLSRSICSGLFRSEFTPVTLLQSSGVTVIVVKVSASDYYFSMHDSKHELGHIPTAIYRFTVIRHQWNSDSILHIQRGGGLLSYKMHYLAGTLRTLHSLNQPPTRCSQARDMQTIQRTALPDSFPLWPVVSAR